MSRAEMIYFGSALFMEDTKMTIEEILKELKISDIGDFTDGYHTFNELYHQRAILFAAIVNQNKDISWKSYRHENGELCFGGGWFIVGIDTPEGSYTYHYKNKYWDNFECEELILGKHWDGHTEKDVTRLLSLPSVKNECRKNFIHLSDIYRLIAGHSNYHGNSILSALTCITEGKTVDNIEPLDNKISTQRKDDILSEKSDNNIYHLTINEYQQNALRTEAERDHTYPRILNGLMGLNGEAGEAIDILKKNLFQGHKLDREHLAKELGDVAWYLAISADAIGYKLEDILQMNVDKLKKRYPDGFKSELSINRNKKDI